MVFEMENVPGMVTLGRSKGEAEGPFLTGIREAADKAGYVFDYRILNAVNYGVPQSRKRVIAIGIRKDLYEQGMRHEWAKPTHDWLFDDALADGTVEEKLATGMQPYVIVKEAIGDLGYIHLSASRPKDVASQPDGSKDRRGDGIFKDKNDKELNTYETRADGYVWYRDSISGNWFRGNARNDYGDKDMNYLKSCLSCKAFNLIVRPACQRCKAPLLPMQTSYNFKTK